ncbi:MAG: DUF1189 domain-containing protein [Proteobacteria bacterium]|jgi:hypothetical protein|nr:DUF1189 family protein [Alphaproteobacteria bacterium]NCC03538.1 DUF1189 domain-containing protein [Pseudomonadota bacterium]
MPNLLEQLRSFLVSIPLTFYSASFYRDLARTGKGLALSYILLSSFLITTQLYISTHKDLELLHVEQQQLFSSLPDAKIEKGQFFLEGPKLQSFEFLKTIEGGPFQIVFDQEAPTLDDASMTDKMKSQKILFWANKTDFFIYSANAKLAEHRRFDQVKDQVIDHNSWMHLSELMSFMTKAPFFYAINLAGRFTSELFSVLILGGIMMLFGRLIKIRDVPYKGFLRLVAAAFIPVSFLGFLVPYQPGMVLLFWVGFSFFGLFALRPPKKETKHTL